MVNVKIISSQEIMEKEVNKIFKYNLAIDQKAFYFDEGAEIFYKDVLKEDLDFLNKYILDFFEFIEKYLNKDKVISFISLGTGDCIKEKLLMELLNKKGYDVKLYGVDSSFQMIEKAKKNLQKLKNETELIYADFSDENFFNKLKSTLDKDSQKIFTFFGGTLGNVPQNYIADKLSNMINKEDLLVIDVRGKNKITDLDSNKYFKNYLKNIGIEKYGILLKEPLNKLGVDINKGEMTLTMNKEKSLGCLVFTFGFKINNNMKFKLNNENITLLNDDYIKLLDIRVYELNGLIDFFETRNFKCLGHKIFNDDDLQIAFKKL